MRKLFANPLPAARGFSLRIALALLAASRVFAEPLHLGEGLSIERPDTLQVAYQTIPSYNASKKMLVHRSDDKLQYFISIERLPRGLTEPDRYFERLARDLRDASEADTFQLLGKGQYQTASGVKASYLEYAFAPNGSTTQQHQIAHFLTNSYRNFIAIAVLIDPDAADLMREDALAMFKSAAIAATNMPVAP